MATKMQKCLGAEYPANVRTAYRQGRITEEDAWRYMFMQWKKRYSRTPLTPKEQKRLATTESALRQPTDALDTQTVAPKSK